MEARTQAPSDKLSGAILRSVSRSFYISVRLLPARLRQPIGLAYLLARATDTLADTSAIPISTRRIALETLASAIQGQGLLDEVSALGNSFAPLQENEAERRLIKLMPECLHQLERVNEADRADIRKVLGKITRAQATDVELFGDPAMPRALATAADLSDYTYLIAGCVGEFWTHLCFRHLNDFSEERSAQMLELGRHYGAGLQLINILRDAGGDLRAGRCYFPADELRARGMEPGQILTDWKAFEPVYEKWLAEARAGLMSGMQYVRAIRDRRVRAATALPALIGARTISRLHRAGSNVLQEKVKVPRAEVRALIASVAFTLAGRRSLQRTFRNSFR
jgi:farnesyl-diphosphate farnesyltransferase